MNTISFMSANYVARPLGYHMTGGWGQGDKATNQYFQPLETFAQRFEEILVAVRAMGFTAIDVWQAHLNPDWATPEHVSIATDLLSKHHLEVTSFEGWFGRTRAEFEAAARLAVALDTRILGGSTPMLERERAFVVATLKKYDLRLGVENHPEKYPREMLARIGDGGEGRIGTTLDTGWYGTQGYNAAEAIAELAGHLFHVHLKDVLAQGSHESCRYGLGVVPIEGCVRALQQIGYGGAISVEHEPETYDPTEDCEADLRMLRGWLAPASTASSA